MAFPLDTLLARAQAAALAAEQAETRALGLRVLADMAKAAWLADVDRRARAIQGGITERHGVIMRTFFDSTCERCGARSSATGVSEETAREIAAIHVCADGVSVPGAAVTVRLVPGPGERLADDELTKP